MKIIDLVSYLFLVLLLTHSCVDKDSFEGALLQDANRTVNSEWSEGSCVPCETDKDCPNQYHTCILWEYIRFDSAAYAWVLDSVKKKCGAHGYAPCGY